MWKLTFLQIHNVNWHYNNFLKENMNTYDIDKIITYTKYIFIYISFIFFRDLRQLTRLISNNHCFLKLFAINYNYYFILCRIKIRSQLLLTIVNCMTFCALLYPSAILMNYYYTIFMWKKYRCCSSIVNVSCNVHSMTLY